MISQLVLQLKAESLLVNSVMLSNLTLTPLTFRLFTQKPFMLVELDPSSNKEGNTKAQSTDMHTLKPRHNLVVSFLRDIYAPAMTMAVRPSVRPYVRLSVPNDVSSLSRILLIRIL